MNFNFDSPPNHPSGCLFSVMFFSGIALVVLVVVMIVTGKI